MHVLGGASCSCLSSLALCSTLCRFSLFICMCSCVSGNENVVNLVAPFRTSRDAQGAAESIVATARQVLSAGWPAGMCRGSVWFEGPSEGARRFSVGVGGVQEGKRLFRLVGSTRNWQGSVWVGRGSWALAATLAVSPAQGGFCTHLLCAQEWETNAKGRIDDITCVVLFLDP